MCLPCSFSTSAASAGIGVISWTRPFQFRGPCPLLETHHALYVPKIVSCGLALDISVQRTLEQNGSYNPLPVKRGVVIMRVRISWTIANISSSFDQASGLV